MPTKKRKLSDLTTADTTALLDSLQLFQATIDENDEDLPPELMSSLETFRAKLTAGKHTTFSRADPYTLVSAGIRHGALFLSGEMIDEIKTLGQLDLPTCSLTFDATVALINLVRTHVSLVTEAGCRVIINIILLRLASSMESLENGVNIIPEYPIPKTAFDTSTGNHSFSGVVDYLLVSAPHKYSRYVLQTPVGALSNPEEMGGSLTPTIIEAKKDNLPAALPQAAVAVASYCNQRSLSFLRGCITSGEQWMFFVYKSEKSGGGKISYVDEINLGPSLENLPLVLGLLKDLVENALVEDLKYFEH